MKWETSMKITLLATSDVHGYIYPTNYATDQEQPYGYAKIASRIKQIRETSPDPLYVIDNGDFIQGSPFSYYLAKQQDHHVSELTNVLNEMDVDASILGNHEFNYGLSYLEQAITSYHHPVLSANILTSKGDPYFGQPYVMIEKQGIKVAILGLTTQYIPHWEQPETIKDLQFVSAVEAAKQYVPKLRELADVVVVAYHGGFEKDLETGEPTEALTGENEGFQLLQEVAGMDALITGHQHRVIAAKVNGVPIIQPGYRGEFLGKIELSLERTVNGYRVSDGKAELISLVTDEADEDILSLVQKTENELQTWLDQPVGEVQGNMKITDPMQARIVEHPYIEFINRVQMAASGVSISGTALFNNEGQGFNETITMREIITNYIYPNTLAVLKITGQDLRDALEQTANFLAIESGEIVFNPAFIEPKPQYYNYDMYEGIDYEIDLRQPVGQRITKLARAGKPIHPEEELEVVMNQYRAVGGGNYHMFSADKIIREIQIDMTELIADYLRKHQRIHAEVNHNFRVIK